VPRQSQDDLTDLDPDDLDPGTPSDPPDEPEDDELDPDEPDLDDEDGDEGEGDEPDGEGDEPDHVDARRQVPDQRRSRQNDRIRTLIDDSKRDKQQLSDLNRRVEELLRNQQQPARRGETEDERAVRRAAMSPEDRIAEDLRNSNAQHQQEMRVLSFTLQDNADKASFEAKCSGDKLYKRFAPKVEEELTNMRRQGQNVGREQMFFFLLGKAMMENRNSPQSRKARRAAADRVRRASTRPANSRSDETPRNDRESNRRSASLEKRLENVNL
jgi:hypothetical protein